MVEVLTYLNLNHAPGLIARPVERARVVAFAHRERIITRCAARRLRQRASFARLTCMSNMYLAAILQPVFVFAILGVCFFLIERGRRRRDKEPPKKRHPQV